MLRTSLHTYLYTSSLAYSYSGYVGNKFKIAIIIYRDLWYRFKAEVLEEGAEEISDVIERFIREIIIETLLSVIKGELVLEK